MPANRREFLKFLGVAPVGLILPGPDAPGMGTAEARKTATGDGNGPWRKMNNIYVYGRPGRRTDAGPICTIDYTLDFAKRCAQRYNARLGAGPNGSGWEGIPDHNGPLDELYVRFLYDD